MKRFLLGISLLAPFVSFANAGGPDAYGYTWKDSNEPGGPAYNWFEISTTGTQVNGLGDDNFVGPIQLGFQFSYYWYTESKVWVGSNGYVEFGPGNLAANFPAIPTSGGVNNYIGGIISDLTFLGTGNPGKVFIWANQDSFCVEYQNVPYWSSVWPGWDQNSSNTFEIILNRLDSSITVNFQSFSGSSFSNYTSGIENGIGTMGLQPLASQPPQQAYTIKYYYPPVSLAITDAGVDWNDNLENGGIFLANNGTPLVLKTQVANHGNQNIGPVSVYEQVNTLANTAVVSNSATTIALVPSQNTMVVFSNSFAPAITGTYRNVTQINGVVGDTIPVNDSIVQEIVVVDTTQNAIRLCYTDNHTNPVMGSISWNGGAGGVGVYIKPPTYPARILSTNYILMSGPGSGLAFFAKVYDDDGPNGSPGTLLDSVPVFANQIVIGAVSNIPLANNVVIQSGGFYVNWEMATTTVSIGQDMTPPFSRRSYETFANIWSTYRDYQTSDFFIGADYVPARPEDVGVSSIVTPANNATVTNTGPVSCYIRNYGSAADNYYITVKYKLGGSSTTISQPYTGGLIPPGDSVLFNFTQQLIVPYTASDVLYVWTVKTSDINVNNDTCMHNVNLVGVEEIEPLAGLSVYPVPSQEQVSFAFANGTNDAVVITITDLMGNVVDVLKFSAATPGAVITIDLGNYAPGSYFYSVQSGDKTGNGKIIRK
jgi:hypothetical protein